MENLALLNEAAGGLDFVEQPCATIADLLELKTLMSTWSAPIKIAVDESIRLSQTLDISEIRDVADVVILKAIPLGGVTKALELALAINLPVVVSGSLDSSVGLSSGISLAASVPNLYGACGLGTGLLFAKDLVTETTTPKAGLISVRRSSPDATLLSQAGASITATEREWWRTRIMDAWHASARDLVSPLIREAVES
jgi:O-succinylbenzoate synthase